MKLAHSGTKILFIELPSLNQQKIYIHVFLSEENNAKICVFQTISDLKYRDEEY